MSSTIERPRAGLWKRTAGVAAVVAVLIVGNTTRATAAAPSAVATLSTGSYTWHVALPPASSASDADTGPQHGEFPVVNADGSVQIRRWQSGAVVASTEGSVTVLSSDGYRSEYRLGTGVDVQAVKDGATITVVGTVEISRTPEVPDQVDHSDPAE